MSAKEEDRPAPLLPRNEPAGRKPYAAPAIVWVEPYEPVAFGLSCAKQPGNPPCNTGPVSS